MGPICVAYILRGQKSANFAPRLGDGATLNSCTLKARLHIEQETHQEMR